jgi:hypothetical protein
VLETGLTITGRVVDREARPLVRWRVDAEPMPYGNTYPRQGTTDEFGRFLIANLDADHRYHLRVDAPETFSMRPRAERADVLPGARDVELVVEDVRVPDARFRGRLLGSDGRPPADLQLVYYPERGDRGGYIEFDARTGAFESEPVLAGRYELRVYRGGQTVHRTEVFELRAGETVDVGELRPGSLGSLELVLKGVPEKYLARLRPLMNRDGHGTEELTLDHGVFRSRAVTPGPWKIELHGPWFLRASEVEVRPDASSRLELAVEPAYEVRIACRFADPAAPWTSLGARVRGEKGETVEIGSVWFRSAMRDGRVRLHGLSLPAGRMLVEASTDSGLAGSAWITAGPGAGAQDELEILIR